MRRAIVLGVLVLLFALLVTFGDNYLLRLATTMAMYATLATAWNVIGGFAGYPSFATAAFFGLGAYASGVALGLGAAFPVAVFVAGLVTAFFSAALGLSILHLRGHYFAIGSLVVADVLREITNNWTSLTGGGMGMNLPLTAGSSAFQARYFLATMTTLAVVAFAVAWWIDSSRLGMALRCIEQNENAAQAIGIDTRRAKVIAFIASSFFIGLTGAAYASWVTYIDPSDVYDVSLSVKPIIMALLGGAGTILGPLIGSAVFLASEELIWRNSLEFHTGILGLFVVALVLFLPSGLGQLRHRTLIDVVARYLRRRPA